MKAPYLVINYDNLSLCKKIQETREELKIKANFCLAYMRSGVEFYVCSQSNVGNKVGDLE